MYARRARIAAVVVCAFAGLISPASALAQSIGDEQYSDPFANPPETKAPSPQSPAAQPSPVPSAPESTVQSAGQLAQTGDAPVAAQTSASGEQLARTGMRPAPLATLGLVLLAGGVLLRIGADRHSRPRGSQPYC